MTNDGKKDDKNSKIIQVNINNKRVEVDNLEYYSTNEETQVGQITNILSYTNLLLQTNALRNYYKKVNITLPDETKLRLVQLIAKTINPIIIAAFVCIYWIVGFMKYFYPSV